MCFHRGKKNKGFCLIFSLLLIQTNGYGEIFSKNRPAVQFGSVMNQATPGIVSTPKLHKNYTNT